MAITFFALPLEIINYTILLMTRLVTRFLTSLSFFAIFVSKFLVVKLTQTRKFLTGENEIVITFFLFIEHLQTVKIMSESCVG